MLKKALIASAVLASVIGAQAQTAPSAGWNVKGTITPATCTLTLGSASADVDYGSISKATAQTLPLDMGGSAYYMGYRSIPVTVGCTAAMPMQLAYQDNKAAQRFNFSNVHDGIRFGLADGGGTVPIGSYQITQNNLTIDGVLAADFLTAPTGSTTWAGVGPTGAGALFAAPGYATGFTHTAGATTPAAVTTIGGTLGFDTFISKAYVDGSTAAITLNGAGTITLQYL